MHSVEVSSLFTLRIGMHESKQRSCLNLSVCFHANWLLKRNLYSKRIEFAPTGSYFFSLRVEPLSEEKKTFEIVTSHESIKYP